MAGFRRAKTVKITWGEDTGEFEGLQVRVRRLSVEQFLDLAPVVDAATSDSFSPQDVAQMRGMFLQFGEFVTWWNVEDEDTGEPVPCTPEEFLRQDIAMVRQIISRWAEEVAGVSAPLERPSPSGVPSLEGSMPMDVLSPSLPS